MGGLMNFLFALLTIMSVYGLTTGRSYTLVVCGFALVVSLLYFSIKYIFKKRLAKWIKS